MKINVIKQMESKQNYYMYQKEYAQQIYEQQGTQKSENSLGNLTIMLIDLIKSQPGRSISMKEATMQLGVQKRRIYDIVNVLESSGLIKKCGKNQIIWKGDSSYSQNLQMQNSLQEYQDLMQEEKYLDEMMKELEDQQKQLVQEMKQQNMLYISEDDIQTILNNKEQSEVCYFSYPEESLIYRQRINNRERLKIENKTGGINFVFSSRDNSLTLHKDQNPFTNSFDQNILPKRNPLQPSKGVNMPPSQINFQENDNKENNYGFTQMDNKQMQNQDLSSIWLQVD